MPQVCRLSVSAKRLTIVLTCVLAMWLMKAPDVADATAIPAQYVAKMYSEVLGRIPDAGAWQPMLDYFAAVGCSQPTLRDNGRVFYTSAEYANLGYDNAAKILTAYRGILNREPDTGGFFGWLSYLDSGGSFSAMVDAFYGGPEFASLVNSICGPSSTYFFGNAPVISIPVSGGGFQGTGAQLQAVLNSTPPGSTVFLAQKAVVQISSSLVIPAGVILATTGYPDRRQYALMGRLVRAGIFQSAVVKVESGALLRNVWVEGQRGFLGPDTTPGRLSTNVDVRGGTGTWIYNNRISDTTGWTNLIAIGSAEGIPCGGNTIYWNLVTVYASQHVGSAFSDGLSIACENATVEQNQIVDATDAGIVLFRAEPAVQRSEVSWNYILNSGNSAFVGVASDHLAVSGVRFAGALIANNTIWTGPNAHIDIVLLVGTRAVPYLTGYGSGAAFTNNTTGSFTARTNIGIAVDGMFDAYVLGNNLSTAGIATGIPCPVVTIAASVSAGWASGTIQGPYYDVALDACLTTGHPNN